MGRDADQQQRDSMLECLVAERIVAAGSALSSRDIAHLRQAPRPVSLKDLTEIAKIGNPVERSAVVLVSVTR